MPAPSHEVNVVEIPTCQLCGRYQPCSSECNGCPECDPGLAPAEAPDEREAAAEAFAAEQICYRTTNPRAFHNNMKRAFLAGWDAHRSLDDLLAEAEPRIETLHQIHGEQCLCGFSSAVSRDRTRHIVASLRAADAEGSGR